MHPTQKALIFGHRFDLPTHLRLPFCGIFLPMFLPLQKHLFSFWRYAAFFSHRTLDTSRWITHCSNAKWLFTPFHTYKLSGIQLHIAAGFCNFPPGHKLFIIIFYSSRTPISPWSSEWELCQRFHTDMGNGQNMVLFPQRGRLSLAKGIDILIRRISNHGYQVYHVVTMALMAHIKYYQFISTHCFLGPPSKAEDSGCIHGAWRAHERLPGRLCLAKGSGAICCDV